MGTAGASAGHGEIDALEVENHAQVHGYGRVHALEDGAGAAKHCVFLGNDLGHGIVHGIGGAVVAVQQTYLMAVQVILVYPGGLQGVAGGAVGVLGRFRHVCTLCAGQFRLQFRLGNKAGEPGTETHFLPGRIQDNTGLTVIQGISYFIQGNAQAGPDTHTCNYYSIHIFSNLIIPFSLQR